MNPKTFARSAARFSFAAAVLATAAVALAQNAFRTIYVTNPGQNYSVWPVGMDVGDNLPIILLGPRWNFGPSTIGGIGQLQIPSFSIGAVTFPAVNLGRTGAKFEITGSGALGIEVQPWYSGGRVDFSIDSAVGFQFKQFPVVGERVTVQAVTRTGAGSWFRTTSPEFGARFFARGDVAGSAIGEVAFLDRTLVSRRNLFTPFNHAPGRQPIGNRVVKFQVPEDVNYILGLLNPTPFGFNLAVPNVAASGENIDGEGRVVGSAFGPFLSVETDVLKWLTLKLPGLYQLAATLLDANLMLPGTNYQVAWSIAKTYANADFGIVGTYSMRPLSTVNLSVFRNSDNVKIGGGTGSATFLMPVGGVRVEQELVQDIEMTSRLGFGMGGAVGVNPFYLKASGTFGSGPHAQSTNLEFDQLRTEIRGNSGNLATFREQTFRLPLPAAQRVRQLRPFNINVYNPNELPPYVYGGGLGQPAIETAAFGTDPDKTFKTVNVIPEQGFRFFRANLISASARLLTSTGVRIIDLNFGSRQDEFWEFQIPRTQLRPGDYTIEFFIRTRNAAGAERSATYPIPLRVFREAPVLDGELFSRADLDPRFRLNRVLADGRDFWVYCGVRNLYRDSVAIVNDEFVVPVNQLGDSALTGQNVIGFRIPGSLARQFASTPLRLQLRNINNRADRNGVVGPPLMSNVKELWIQAPVPTITNYSIRDVVGGPLRITASTDTIEVRGTGFMGNSAAGLQYRDRVTNFLRTIPLETTVNSPTVMRARVPVSSIETLHRVGGTVQLVTWTTVVRIPEGGGQPSAISGGTSNRVNLPTTYPEPSISRLDPGVLVGGVPMRVRVFGDNLYRYSGLAQATIFEVGGRVLPFEWLTPGPGTLTVPYVDINIPANDPILTSAGARQIRAINRNVRSETAQFQVQHAAPAFAAGILSTRITGNGINLRVLGGVFYPTTTATLGGRPLTVNFGSSGEIVLLLNGDAADGINAPSADLVLTNPAPGGGTASRSVTLVEGVGARFSVSADPPVRQGSTNNWTQTVRFTQDSLRVPPARVELETQGVPGTRLTNRTGIRKNGAPFIRLNTGGIRQFSVTLQWNSSPSEPLWDPQVTPL